MRKSLAILMLAVLALFTLPVAAAENARATNFMDWLLALVGLDDEFGGYTVPGGLTGQSSPAGSDSDEYGIYTVPGGSTAAGSDSDEFGGMTVPGGLTEPAPDKGSESDEFGGMTVPGG